MFQSGFTFTANWLMRKSVTAFLIYKFADIINNPVSLMTLSNQNTDTTR